MLIGEVAKKSGLSKDGIRHYESLGLLHSKPIQAGSRTYRDYDDTTLERLMIISLAKRLHFSLKELVDPLNQILSDTVSREERASVLADKVKEIDAKIAELTAARDLLKIFVENPDKSFVDARLKEMGLWLE